MIPNTFGRSAPFSLGVEEELQILDASTLAQVPGVDRILARVEGQALPGRLKTELHASIVETNSPVCESVGEVEE